MDLKVMLRSYKGLKYILYIIDEVTIYLIMVLIHQSRSEEIGNALIKNVISKYCVPDYILIDQDSTFMSLLINYLFKKLNIKIKTVAPHNHQLLQAEHGIESFSIILTKHLLNLGQMWPKYLPLATFAYNTFNTPSLANYSPYELVFSRKPKLLINLEATHDIKVLGAFEDYYTLVNKRLQYLHKLLQKFRSKRLAMISKDRNFFQYNSRDLVYIISPLTSQLQTSLTKVAIKYIGPLVVNKIIDPHLLMMLDGKILSGLFEHEWLKPTIIRTSQGNVCNLLHLKQVVNIGMKM